MPNNASGRYFHCRRASVRELVGAEKVGAKAIGKLMGVSQ